ncbi:MAG: TonB-dependent receptor [Bacteroidia bacterium]|nr:TonB-dependent receptor [Bacteroidia bacterium]
MFFFGNTFAQQQEYYFNSPGNICYFKYVCYTQTNIYNSIKQPFIFVLGKSGETANEAFTEDTLKNLQAFNNYMFVYLPNKGNNAHDKLQCLDAFASLQTYNYKYGHSNLFLTVNDPEISQSDISANGLNSIFKNVRLASPGTENISQEPSIKIADDFKETHIIYEIETKHEDVEYGTYYTEDESTESIENDQSVKPKKIYFGPPASYNFTLTGIVRDKSTGEALPFATLMIKGTTTGTSTNVDGYFTLLKVPSDTSVLIAQYVGYGNTGIYLTPQTPKKNFTIEIQPSTQNLKAITVIGHREDVVITDKSDVGTVKMTPRKLELLPNVGERDIMRSFQLMPGVSASNESSSGLYVRGGTPDQNLVLYDGFTVYHVDHLYGFFSAFNSNALKDVELYKGGFESRFGGRLSSVTEITGKDGNQNFFNMGADISLLSFNAYVEIPVGKKFSSFFAFRRSYKGFIYNKIFEKFNGSTSSVSSVPQGGGPGGRQMQDISITSYFYDLNGKLTYRPTDKDIISLSIFNGTDKLDNSSPMHAFSFGASNSDFSMNSTDLTKYGNIGSSLKWSRKWNDKLYGNTILSYSNYYSNRDRSQERTVTSTSGETTTSNNGVFENNDLKDYSLKTDYQWDIANFSQFQFGGFGNFFDIDYSYAQNDTSSVLNRKNNAILAGGYLQNNFKLFNDKIILLPGIRTSYFQTTHKIYYEPRASITFKITDKFSLKGATGKYYQFANRVTREDIMSGSKEFWLLSDGNSVPVSSSVHYVAGLSYEPDDYLFSVETYYKKINNLTEYSLRFNPSPLGTSYDENFFNGYGYSRGIELLAQKKSGKFNGWVSYTLGEARNHFTVYSDTYYPANQDVTHEFKIVGLYKYKRWDFSVSWIFATGHPYTAPSGAYSITLLDGTTQDFFTVTSKNSLRLPDYHRCDISANYKLLEGIKGDKRRRELGYIGFSVFNLYDRKNIWYKQFTIEDGEIIETNVNYLGFTPNLTLSFILR